MKKRILLGSSFILILSVFLYFLYRNSNFKELKCYEEHKHDKNSITRVFLVKSLPLSLNAFENDLKKQLKSISKIDLSCSENIYFVKEVDHNIVNRLIWGDDEQYENCTAELNNIDYLAKAHFFKTSQGKDTLSIIIYSGSLYHY